MLKKNLYKLLIDELKRHVNSFNYSGYLFDYTEGRIHQILDLIRTIWKCETNIHDVKIDKHFKIVKIYIYGMKHKKDEVIEFD